MTENKKLNGKQKLGLGAVALTLAAGAYVVNNHNDRTETVAESGIIAPVTRNDLNGIKSDLSSLAATVSQNKRDTDTEIGSLYEEVKSYHPDTTNSSIPVKSNKKIVSPKLKVQKSKKVPTKNLSDSKNTLGNVVTLNPQSPVVNIVVKSNPEAKLERYTFVIDDDRFEATIARPDGKGNIFYSDVERKRDLSYSVGKEGKHSSPWESAVSSVMRRLVYRPNIENGTQTAYNDSSALINKFEDMGDFNSFLKLGNLENILEKSEELNVPVANNPKKDDIKAMQAKLIEQNSKPRESNVISPEELIKINQKNREERKNKVYSEEVTLAQITALKSKKPTKKEDTNSKFTLYEVVIAGSNYATLNYSSEIINLRKNFDAFGQNNTSAQNSKTLGFIVPINNYYGNTTGWTYNEANPEYQESWEKNVLTKCLDDKLYKTAISKFNCGYTSNLELLGTHESKWNSSQKELKLKKEKAAKTQKTIIVGGN